MSDDEVKHLVVFDDSDLSILRFTNYTSLGKISSGKGIYDGDSVYCTVPYKGTFIKLYIRIDGIDTPEIRTRNPIEKAAARRAKSYLRDLINVNPDSVVKVCISSKHGKYYGRNLGELYQVYYNDDNSIRVSDVPISQLMLQSGHAYAYHGKKKRKFADWYTLPTE